MGSNHGKIEKVVYGEDEETQFMNLHYPTNSPSSPPPYPVVIILHGGYWKNKYGVENSGIGGLAPFFASHGAIAVEIEYRRRDHEGGGLEFQFQLLKSIFIILYLIHLIFNSSF